MASLRTFARKVAADDETWRNNNQTWARANFSFFIYFLFQIKWHFEFFFYWKMGGGYPPYPPPLYPPLLSHFFLFHHKPKRMLEFLRNGVWIVIVQKIRNKGLSYLVKMHFSVSGHVTLGLVRWRHELDYFCPLWVLSKFGPIEAYMCRVIASWFFPSNGIKIYFNGPFNFIPQTQPITMTKPLNVIFIC